MATNTITVIVRTISDHQPPHPIEPKLNVERIAHQPPNRSQCTNQLARCHRPSILAT
ncbi:hypothetical protein SESBI_45404, partial [Sesbania bispinosa]